MNDVHKSICTKSSPCWSLDFQQALINLEISLRDIEDSTTIIQRAIRAAAEFYQADRAYVLEVDNELCVCVNTYEWCAESVTPQINNLQFMPCEGFPRWNNAFKKNMPIITERLEDIKKDYPDEYNHLKAQDVTSLLAVPFFKRINEGYLGVDNPKRYIKDPGMLFVLSYVVVLELNEIKLQESVRIANRYASKMSTTDIQINLFGGLEVITANGTLRDEDFPNDASYNLLAFLVLNRSKTYSIRILTEAIWENTEVTDPYNALKNVVYRLRNTLSYVELKDLIVASRGTFSLNPTYNITTDVERFEETCKKVSNTTTPEILHAMYASLMGLYQGCLLPRHDYYQWLMPKIMFYQNLYVQRLKEYMELLYSEKKYIEMQKVASDALAIDMYESDMHYYLIKAACESGSKNLARAYLRRNTEYLSKEHLLEFDFLLR